MLWANVPAENMKAMSSAPRRLERAVRSALAYDRRMMSTSRSSEVIESLTIFISDSAERIESFIAPISLRCLSMSASRAFSLLRLAVVLRLFSRIWSCVSRILCSVRCFSLLTPFDVRFGRAANADSASAVASIKKSRCRNLWWIMIGQTGVFSIFRRSAALTFL